MKDIKIVVDTSADTPQELVDKYDFGMLRFMSIFGEESFVAGTEITNEQFFEKLTTTDVSPTTAQTPYGDMYDYLLEQCKEHESVIYFTLSSKGSGQYNTARLVKEEILEEYPQADLHVVDTMTYSLYIARMAIHAAEMIKAGEENIPKIIEESVASTQNWKCFLLVDTLKYLERGGRINKASAVVGTLLDIKPVLGVKDGLIESHEKLRGNKKLVDKLIEKACDDPDFDDENPAFLIVHSAEDKANQLKEKLEDRFGEGCVEIMTDFGPIIGTHVGPGAFAIIEKTK